MACKEDMKAKLRRVSSEKGALYHKLEKDIAEISKEIRVPMPGFIITEDMTEEEALMEIIEAQLKAGSSLEDAEREAKEIYEVLKQWQKEWEEEALRNLPSILETPKISGTA